MRKTWIRRENRSRIKMTKTIAMVFLLGLVLLGISYGADFFGGSLKSPTAVITVPAGSGTDKVATVLKQCGAIRHKTFFKLASKLKGADNHYLEGQFEVQRGMGYNRLMELLTKPSDYNTSTVTIYEGMTVKQIAALLEENGVTGQGEFLATCQEGAFDYEYLPTKKRNNRLEGYLFPDTYAFYKGSSPETVIQAMLKRFDEKFNDEYRQRAQQLGKAIDEIIIMASLVEGEAQSGEDRPLVAGVFYNRLKSKLPYEQYLQSCASVQYILGEKKPVLSIDDTKINSPYNTYRYRGLPVGPICCPGEASIRAALWPAETAYRYFQSNLAGKLYFAKTLDEHEAIKVKIQGN